MALPIDTSTLQIVVTEPCAPRLDRQTGEQRTDRRTGLPIWDTGLLIGDGTEATPVRVKTFTENNVPQMMPVTVPSLGLTVLNINGDVVYIFSADAIVPAAGGEWGPAPAANPGANPAASPAANAAADSAAGKSAAGSSGSRGGGSGSPGGSGTGGSSGKAGGA